MTTIPIVLGPEGAQPQSIASLLAQLIAIAEALSPGLTANLPATLIEDVSSTEVAGVSLADAAWVELLNSLTPYGANPFILNQMGALVGIPPNVPTNTSVFCVFTGTVGYPISPGFLVTDGTYQYSVYAGAVIPSSGITGPVLCIATVTGSWAVPQNTVNELATSVAATISLSVTNPNAGTPSQGVETVEQFQSRVIQGYEATAVGVPNFLYTLLTAIPGVDPRLTTVVQIDGGGWEIIVGGSGDPYAIAFAIFQGLADISSIVGSTMTISGITNANPGVATTVLNHGLSPGDIIVISGSINTAFNGTYTVGAAPTEKTFKLGVDTTGFGAYTGGGVITPNPRNQTVSISQPPNTYSVTFVEPPAQTVLVTMTWNTTATNIISDTAVALLGAPAIAAYINSIPVGQPINLFEIDNAFQAAVVGIIPTPLLTRMVKTITINGIVTAAVSGTGIVEGDPESYFLTNSADITVTQG